jgi:hypothetical protein
MKRVLLFGLLFALAHVLLLTLPVVSQQTFVTRFDAYGGYAFLDTPHLGLFENGFATQVGYRPRTWVSFGFDYSITTGDSNLTPNLLTSALQQQLGAQLAGLAAMGLLPPGYTVSIPASSRTQTFAVGPQLAYRHFQHLTLFLRPVFAGAIHQTTTPHPAPGDAIAAGIVSQLTPSGKKTDTAPFVGFGGGFDMIFSRHFSLRTQADLVYDHLFNDLLPNGQFTVRFSVGPAFNFGRNIAQAK